MIGRFQIEIGSDQLVSGMASTDVATDGALGVESTGLNPFLVPGAMYSLSAPTDLHANLADNVIASCEDSEVGSTSSYNRIIVGDAGNYYTFALPSTLTKVATATTNAAYYTAALTDMVSFQGNTYVSTSNGDIDLYNVSGGLTNSWWKGTKGQPALQSSGGATVPIPMINYTGKLYIAAGNKIHGWDGTNIDTFFPGLPLIFNTNEIIYALGIDPITGLLLISVQTTINISGTLSAQFFVYLWDGFSAQPYRKIPVDDLVTSFHHIEGTVFVASGNNLGTWNGNGVTFLRKLLNAGLTSTDLVYKHHITNTRGILQMIDGPNVLSYGTVIGGKPRAFFYTANTTTTNHGNCIFPVGDYQLCIADASGALWLWNYSSTAAGAGVMPTNDIYFPRPVFLRRIRILTSGITTTAGVGLVTCTDDSENVRIPAIDKFVVTSGTKYLFDFEFAGYKMMSMQPEVTFATQGFGVLRMWLYYDIAE